MLCALIRWKLWAAADAPYACPQCPAWVSKVCGLRLAAHAPKELEDGAPRILLDSLSFANALARSLLLQAESA